MKNITRPAHSGWRRFAAVVPLLVAACYNPRGLPVTSGELDAARAPAAVDAAAGGGSADGGQAPSPAGVEPASCAPGFHVCAGRCVDSGSVMSCGLACEPCPNIEGGMPACTAGRCTVSCPPGQKPCLDRCLPLDAPCDDACPPGKNLCGGICVERTSRTACGTACAVCPTAANGSTSCDGDTCQLSCEPGFHRCNDSCLGDLRPESCGTSCAPCPIPTGGKATCDGVRCGAECPAGTKLCLDACIPTDAPCNGECPPGKRNCNGSCVSRTDVNFCGPTCAPCQAPDNGEVRCENDACVVSCRTGFHRCGDRCADDRSVDSCGTACARCPGTANGMPTCDGSACGIRCNSGFHDCDGVCKSNSDVASCGGRCQPCAAPAGGTPACRGGQCTFDCTGGRRECDGQCIPAGQACGSSCPEGLKFCSDSGTCKPRNQCCEACSATGCNTTSGECNFCRPNAASCRDGNTARQCSPDGTRFVDQPCLPAQTNETSRCAANRCESSCHVSPGKACGDGKCWSLPFGCQECQDGFIWRAIRDDDQICVDRPEFDRVREQNAAHPGRRTTDPVLIGQYGPEACVVGFVWREAVADDKICVTTEERDEAARQRQRHRERTRVGQEAP